MNLDLLLVDDDAIVLLLHTITLKSTGFHDNPVLCNNGKEALNHILQDKLFKKNYLIFLDINMPVMGGWEFLDELTKYSDLVKNTSVIIVSSSINAGDKVKAFEYSNVIDYFEKPISEKMLAELKIKNPQLTI
jgi:CheY-like chemotaxis protein